VGTSKSFNGMKDKNPLLPTWSLSDISSEKEPSSEPANSVGVTEPSSNPSMPWRAANASLGKLASGNVNRGEYFQKAGSSYTRARGGSRAAASSSTSARASSAKLGSFLSGIGSRGINQTLKELGLSRVVGQDVDRVIAAILDFIAPDAASREDSIVRESVCETLENLYEKYDLSTGDITNLDRMSVSDIKEAFENAISSYIYNRWLAELGIAIEKKSISQNEAVSLEREMKTYVYDSVKIDLQGIDILNFDWHSDLGQQFIEQKFQDAYDLIQGEDE
jgi:hypothetical protein